MGALGAPCSYAGHFWLFLSLLGPSTSCTGGGYAPVGEEAGRHPLDT
jgi:hypothetical protein